MMEMPIFSCLPGEVPGAPCFHSLRSFELSVVRVFVLCRKVVFIFCRKCNGGGHFSCHVLVHENVLLCILEAHFAVLKERWKAIHLDS